jgi:prephenate dehydrogenase
VLVVGAGLMGTSLGLALRDHRPVLLLDQDEGRLRRAVDRGAGQPWDGSSSVGLAVAAVPPALITPVLNRLQASHVAQTYTHLSSIQSRVQRDLETSNSDLTVICGGHPLAGRETSGPDGATAELFLGRPWVLCPSPSTGQRARDDVARLAADCGGEAVVMTPEQHDRAVALVSHLPQVAASAVAARLLTTSAEEVAVSGPGLHDTTRVAASDPALWSDVLSGNAACVAPLVHDLAQDLTRLADALAELGSGSTPTPGPALDVVRDLLERGNRGRALVPVKRGEHDRDFATVAVAVPDQPGQLAAVFVCAADAGVNVEDVRVEHLPGRPTGVLELLVQQVEREPLQRALAAAGFEVLRTA